MALPCSASDLFITLSTEKWRCNGHLGHCEGCTQYPIRISFKADSDNDTLPQGQDYPLCHLRFFVQKSRISTLTPGDTAGDMSNWRTASGHFIPTEQSNTSNDDPENTAHISCFLKSLLQHP